MVMSDEDKIRIKATLELGFWLSRQQRNLDFDDQGRLIVDGDANCKLKNTPALPIKFASVSGDMNLHDVGLHGLHGCPHTVGEDFVSSKNPLTTLEGGPVNVGKMYSIAHALITDFTGFPQTIGKEFFVVGCPNLSSFKGLPDKLPNMVDISDCAFTSLVGLPQANNWGLLNVEGNKLTDLEGAPSVINGDFLICRNPLKSFKGLPTLVKGELRISYDKNLPMLRLLACAGATFRFYDSVRDYEGDDEHHEEGHHQLSSILEQYRLMYHERPNKAMMACQKALMDTDYRSNAKW